MKFFTANILGKWASRLAAVALLAALSPLASNAEIPAGYYRSLNGLKDANLKTAVHNLVRNFTLISSYQALPQYFRYTDTYPESNRWWDMYSNIPFYAPSFSGLNREHSFPKSWWGGSSNNAYKDLYNLMPCEKNINTSKSNYGMGVVTSVTTDNGCTKVGTGAGGKKLWEPANKWKGEFARGYMYMATAYQNFTWEGQALNSLQQGAYPTLQKWASDLYIDWAEGDPVDQMEIDRNQAVAGIQGNRNPFIDYPNLAE